jgi:hypothetical protein
VVEGVALEMLCKLLFTEGSNPSLSLFLSFIKYYYFLIKPDENNILQLTIHLFLNQLIHDLVFD